MPIYNFNGISPLTGDQFVSTLQKLVTKRDWLGRPKENLPFTGKVYGSGFRIMRAHKVRDSFNPVMYGRLIPSSEGSRIKIFMTFHPSVWAFIVAWTGSLGYHAFVGLFHNKGIEGTPLLFIMALWGMAVPYFYSNVKRNEQLLREHLKLDDAGQNGG